MTLAVTERPISRFDGVPDRPRTVAFHTEINLCDWNPIPIAYMPRLSLSYPERINRSTCEQVIQKHELRTLSFAGSANGEIMPHDELHTVSVAWPFSSVRCANFPCRYLPRFRREVVRPWQTAFVCL